MLRLWPETLYGGLFCGSAWLSAGGRTVQQCSPAGNGELLAEMEVMLQRLAPTARGRRLHLQVSDSLAAIAMLPWQEQLRGQDELVAYAQACFDRSGMEINDQWVVHAGFRLFGHNGLACALPRAWLDQLATLCERYRVRLLSVLPVSGAAYWHGPRLPLRQRSLILLSEPQRVSALAFEGPGLVGTDVQPLTGDTSVTGKRLLCRLGARYAEFAEVRHWSPAPDVAVAPAFIGHQFAEAAVVQLRREVWK